MRLDLTIIFLLIAADGFFAMSELAVVSARKARRQVLLDEGYPGAASGGGC